MIDGMENTQVEVSLFLHRLLYCDARWVFAVYEVNAVSVGVINVGNFDDKMAK